jgi:hypothetical protein
MAKMEFNKQWVDLIIKCVTIVTYRIKVNGVSVFFCTGKMVGKITCSSSEVVLRTIKHTMIYPISGPSSNLIAPHPMVFYRI